MTAATTATATDPLTALRPRLFGIAYRMLGVRADAEDVLQDAWLRWSRQDTAARRRPGKERERDRTTVFRTPAPRLVCPYRLEQQMQSTSDDRVPVLITGGLVTVVPIVILFLLLERYFRGGLLQGSTTG